MKASELIAQLQEIIDKYGDIKVISSCYGGYAETVAVIEDYDDENDFKPFHEICIR